MDIRGPRLRKPSDRALKFTSSMAYDGRIARHVVEVNMAHMLALVRAQEVDRSVGAKCLKFLLGTSLPLSADPTSEDIHQLLEQKAVDALGIKTAGFLNYGKSRNDQVATAVRMEARDGIIGLLGSISDLQGSILEVVRREGSSIIPGYTHLQRAQPVTLAHHYFAYFDSLQRDVERLLELYSRVNLSPMGSAAMAGTSAKVDRGYLAGALGFAGIVRNAMDGVSSRDVVVEALSCAALTMLDISRISEELILWSSSEFGSLELDDRYAASSSIMPQKKNAVVAEIARAKTGSVLGDLVAVCTIMKALPYSYNLDLQETTPPLWRAIDDATTSATVIAEALATVKFNTEATMSTVSKDNSTAVGLANYLVKDHGFSFREAHSMVAEMIRISEVKGTPLEKVVTSQSARISKRHGKKVSIDRDTARSILDPSHFLSTIATEGGSNPRFISGGLSLRTRELSKNRAVASGLSSRLSRAMKALDVEASEVVREVKSSN